MNASGMNIDYLWAYFTFAIDIFGLDPNFSEWTLWRLDWNFTGKLVRVRINFVAPKFVRQSGKQADIFDMLKPGPAGGRAGGRAGGQADV